MKATVVRCGKAGNYLATTVNDIALSFSVLDGTVLNVGDELEVDLVEVVCTRTIVRSQDERRIAVAVRENDLHDLRLPAAHGHSRVPSAARRRGDT